MRQPLLAAPEHGDQQPLQTHGIVVHEPQCGSHRVPDLAPGFQQGESLPRCCRVVFGGAFRHLRLCAETRQQRHLPGQAGRQGIQRHDAQASGVGAQAPVAFRVTRPYGQCPAPGFLLVRRQVVRRVRGGRQTAQDTITHLTGSFVGERECQHLFRLIDHGQQTQHALRQQFRLARARRGFNDERGERQGALPRRRIVRQTLRLDFVNPLHSPLPVPDFQRAILC